MFFLLLIQFAQASRIDSARHVRLLKLAADVTMEFRFGSPEHLVAQLRQLQKRGFEKLTSIAKGLNDTERMKHRILESKL